MGCSVFTIIHIISFTVSAVNVPKTKIAPFCRFEKYNAKHFPPCSEHGGRSFFAVPDGAALHKNLSGRQQESSFIPKKRFFIILVHFLTKHAGIYLFFPVLLH